MRRLLVLATLLPLSCTLEVPLKAGLSNEATPPSGTQLPDDPPATPGPPGTIGTPNDPATPNTDEPSPSQPPSWTPTTPTEPTTDPVPLAPAVDLVTASEAVVAALRPEDGCVALADPANGAVTVATTLCAPRAMAALASGDVLVLENGGRRLWSVHQGGAAPTLLAESQVAFTAVVVAPDEGLVVLATAPVTPGDMAAADLNPTDLNRRRMAILDLTSGHLETYLTAYAIRDVDITATRIVVTMGHHDIYGFPEAVLQVFARNTLAYLGDVTFPNCADDLQIHPDGRLAVLAPRTCALHDVMIAQPEIVETWSDWDDVPPNGDPISFVDLEAVEHLANVPGFGPAVFSPDGHQAVGFTMRETLNVEWNLFPIEDFGVVVANSDDYTFDLYEAGDVRPDFAYAPDGNLFIQGQRAGQPYLAVLDRAAGAFTPVPGAPVSLSRRVAGPDGQLYVASGGALGRVSPDGVVAISASHGDIVTRAGGYLIFTDRAAGTHTVIDLANESETTITYGVIDLNP